MTWKETNKPQATRKKHKANMVITYQARKKKRTVGAQVRSLSVWSEPTIYIRGPHKLSKTAEWTMELRSVEAEASAKAKVEGRTQKISRTGRHKRESRTCKDCPCSWRVLSPAPAPAPAQDHETFENNFSDATWVVSPVDYYGPMESSNWPVGLKWGQTTFSE